MSTHSSSDEHSDTHSSHGSDYTNPSSVASVGDDDEHSQHSQEQTKGFVQGLLKEKKEHEILLKAWAERCRTLEEEVGRLARLVQSMELDRSSAVATQPSTAEPALCRWNGSAWIPVATSPTRHIIDPSKSMSKQYPPPCNSHYIVGRCDVPRCKFSHLYDMTPSQLEEIRRGARFRLCHALKNGVECEDPECCYGHVCPRGRACGRNNCAFNDEQHRLPSSTAKTSRTKARR